MQNIIDADKTLMTIVFNFDVLKQLQCKVDDYLIIMQSNFDKFRFLMVKSDSGYRIKRFPNRKRLYQINISHPFSFIPEFDFKECTYFVKKNSIRIHLKNLNEKSYYV